MDKCRHAKDVTGLVRTGSVDDEYLPIEKCLCGAVFLNHEFAISIYPEDANECPSCGRKYYFRNQITIYEVK